jgi:hypothetical protein
MYPDQERYFAGCVADPLGLTEEWVRRAYTSTSQFRVAVKVPPF